MKLAVIIPCYNERDNIPLIVERISHTFAGRANVEVILVDNGSTDGSDVVFAAQLAGQSFIRCVKVEQNKGYGGNQKSCYNKALEIGADIVIMVHPDYQYTPKLIPSMCYLIANDVYQVVMGSRILGKGALKGGMPMYKYIANRLLTFTQNVLMNQKLSEYHTGYRAFSREVLESINYNINSDDFVFDNQMLAQICFEGYEIAEVTCPTKYFDEASSINFKRSSVYGLGVLWTSFSYFLQKMGLGKFKIFKK